MAGRFQLSVDDLVMLEDVSGPGITQCLKSRYQTDLIYTLIGPVLISVNPYTQLPIYGPDKINQYLGRFPYELPPHVYAIAEDTYRSMLTEQANQCIIISGESGAGKTEASKRIMEYIATVSAGGSERVEHVKKIFVESNPLLEAFGNAKTQRNDNSSRFGKYMEMEFNFGGQPEGGRITNYLLEKSRVVKHAPGERDFHIFYQLLAGASEDEKQRFYLSGRTADDFFYTANTISEDISAGINDAANYTHTRAAMGVVGIDPTEQDEIMSVVAGILHLGNITFVPANSGPAKSRVDDRQSLQYAAELLGVTEAVLEQALLFRTVRAAKRSSRSDVPLDVAEAAKSRDSLAKGLYGRLFNWLVGRINRSIALKETGYVIGVLDIYGFEIFQENSFEQLCINYCNEKLQQVFIELTLKSEQEEYANEGIAWENVQYFNNKECVELIERRLGVFALLDEESISPMATDERFLTKLNQQCSNHPHYRPSERSRSTFSIIHYAGEVAYEREGFLDKNKDTFFNDLKAAMATSRFAFVREMFPDAGEDDIKRPQTAAMQFKNSLNALMTTLYSCHPHYIRCIKPNSKKKAKMFEDELVSTQVRYLGLLENVRVRRAGYAYRQTFEKFYHRYKMICKETWPNYRGGNAARLVSRGLGLAAAGTNASSPDIMREACRKILDSAELQEGRHYQFGKTKVFVRQPQAIYTLEEVREHKLVDLVKKIQSTYRAFRVRKYFLELRAASMEIYGGKKERRRASVKAVFKGDHLAMAKKRLVKRAIMAKFGAKKVLFSAVVNKIATNYKAQPRTLLVTDEALYLVPTGGKVAIKRRIMLSEVRGLAVSEYADNYLLIVIDPATAGNHDLLLESDKRTELVTILRDTMKRYYNAELPLTVSSTIQFQARKGKKCQIVFKKNDELKQNKTSKHSGNLHVEVAPVELATLEDWKSVIEYQKLHRDMALSKPRPLLSPRVANK